MSQDRAKQTADDKWPWFPKLLLLVGAASLIAGIALAVMDWPRAGETFADAGPKGDFWGGHIGAFAAFAGTCLFGAALFLQSQELKEQRKDLRLTQQIAERQEEALREQNRITSKTAAITRLLELSAARRSELDRAYAELHVGPDREPAIKNNGLLHDVARMRMRAIALGELIEGLLQSDTLTQSERVQLRVVAELDHLQPPPPPSVLARHALANKHLVPEAVQEIKSVISQYG